MSGVRSSRLAVTKPEVELLSVSGGIVVWVVELVNEKRQATSERKEGREGRQMFHNSTKLGELGTPQFPTDLDTRRGKLLVR